MVNKTQFYKTKVALAVVLSLGLAACGDSDGDEGAVSNSTSTTTTDAATNTVENAAGTGSVQGTVLDTNALPIMGAIVSLAGQTVTTDASGYYHFTDVPVSGVSGSNVANAATPYVVTITAPAGYANATVLVTTNNIQIDSGNNGTNANVSQVEASGEQITWFDGFLAQADVAELPKFAASVTGVLRDCNTGAALPAGVKLALDFTSINNTTTNTGANVDVGVPVFTAMTGENGVFTFTDIPEDSLFGLSVEGYSANTTGSTEATEGGFDDVTIITDAEGIVNNIGDQNVCLITSSDNIAPHIASVGSTISDTTSEGFEWQVLSKGVDGTQGIVLRFNEALNKDAIDINDIVVTAQVDFNDVNDGETVVSIASAVVADDGMSMTISLGEALAEMTKFSIWMPRYQYEDTSANRIVTGDASGTEQDPDGLNNDLVDDSNASVSAALTLNSAAVDSDLTFTARDSGAASNAITVTIVDGGVGAATAVSVTNSAITITIDDAAANVTSSQVANAVALNLAATSLVSVSAEGAGTGVVDLFGATALAGGSGSSNATGSSEFGISSDTINDTQFKTEYVRTRLCTYIPPVTDPGSIDGEQRVKTVIADDADIDAVGVFWDNSGSATISNLNGQHDQTEDLLQELWNRKNPTSAQNIVDDTAVIDGNLNDATNIIASTGTASTSGSTWSVVVTGAEHGDTVTVTPTAAFNIIGTPITVTLEDKVAPTTIIQDSYNYADTFSAAYVNSVAADDGYANGGELSQAGTSGSEGSPILYVTPRLFASDTANDDDANFNNRFDVFRSITDGNTQDGNGDALVTSTTNFLYDVNAIANWSAISADIGVAFSENVDLNAGTAVSFLLSNAATTTTLTGFVANNGLRNEDYIAADTDQSGYHTYLTHGLIQMTSNDVVGLANSDHNAVIDYTGAVLDTVNDNVALSDSLVVIADAIPPLVVSAELDATQFVVTFNEAVTTNTGSITIIDPTDGTTDITLNVSAATASAGNTVLTWTGVLPSRSAFSNSTVALAPASYLLDGVDDFGGVNAETETIAGTFGFAETVGGDVLGHAILSWGSVEDARGNAWNDYHNLYSDSVTVALGSTANNGVIDSQEDNVNSTNGFRLAIPDLPMYLATDTIVPFGVTVAFSALDEDGTPGVDANFDITITATNPISLTNDAGALTYLTATDAEVAAEDGWRALGGGASNVTDGWDLSEINTHFRIVDSGAVQTALNGPIAGGTGSGVALDSDLLANGGNNDGQVSPEELANFEGAAALLAIYDANDFPMIAGTSASFNGDNTVLTISTTVAANSFAQGAGVEFVKITPTWTNITGAAPGGALNTNVGNEVTPAGDDVDVRFGHIEGTILGTNDEEQSGSVKREF